MGRTILITGGARSGKSSFAEKLAVDYTDKALYIATAVAFDDEMKNRIKRHREVRPSNWDTYEGYKGLGTVLSEKGKNYSCILLDCVTVMVTNLLFEYPDLDFDNPEISQLEAAEQYVRSEFTKLIDSIKRLDSTVIMVTNELGSGIVPDNMLTRYFRDIAGRINQYAAENSDEVYMTVCGIPLKIK